MLTIISMAVHRDVPQYIAIPWLITCVIALTISTERRRRRRKKRTFDRIPFTLWLHETIRGVDTLPDGPSSSMYFKYEGKSARKIGRRKSLRPHTDLSYRTASSLPHHSKLAYEIALDPAHTVLLYRIVDLFSPYLFSTT